MADIYVIENAFTGADETGLPIRGEIHGSYMLDRLLADLPPGRTAAMIIVGAPPGGSHGGWYTPEAYVVTLTDAIDYAYQNGALGVSRSYGQQWQFYNVWEYARSLGLIVWHAHHGNEQNLYTEFAPRMYWPITVGGEDPDTSLLERTRGPGLEVDTWTPSPFDPLSRDTQESPATQSICGLTIRIMDERAHPDKLIGYFDARALIRQAASDYATGHNPNRYGYGFISHDLTPSGVVELQPPIDIRVDRYASGVRLRWVNFRTSNWRRTVVVTQDHAGVYEGTGESVIIPDVYGPDPQSFYFYSEGLAGDFSRDDNANVGTLVAHTNPIAAPNAPVIVRVSSGVRLTWPNSLGAVGYEVERPDGSVVTASSPYVHALDAKRPGRYRVRAKAAASYLAAGRPGRSAWSLPGYAAARPTTGPLLSPLFQV